MVLNNQTREGFNEQSHVENVYGVAGNYGVWLNYRFKGNHHFAFEFSIDAVTKQSYNVFYNGNFYHQEWEFKYNRWMLGYKYNFGRMGKEKGIPSNFFIQAGAYIGYLREANIYYDGVLMFDGLLVHKRYDVGLNLLFGHEIRLENIIIGYGLRADFGLLNIFSDASGKTSDVNPTNLFNLGANIKLGYCF